MEANSAGGMSTERGRWGVIPTELRKLADNKKAGELSLSGFLT